MTLRNKLSMVCALTGTLATTLLIGPASAQTIPVCTPTQVAFDGTNKLAVYCPEGVTPAVPPNIPARNGWSNAEVGQCATIDAVKSWFALAQAAILSGKRLRINLGGGVCNEKIIWMQLDK